MGLKAEGLLRGVYGQLGGGSKADRMEFNVGGAFT